jgi:hypothetical protein
MRRVAVLKAAWLNDPEDSLQDKQMEENLRPA